MVHYVLVLWILEAINLSILLTFVLDTRLWMAIIRNIDLCKLNSGQLSTTILPIDISNVVVQCR
jgi:hypothetical protein